MIRPVAEADLEAILAIWNPLIRGTAVTFNAAEKSPAELARMIAARRAEGREFLVAGAPGQVLGFASYDQFRGGNGYARAMEHTVILGEGARGRGLGRALMAAVEDHARAGGAGTMIAGISAENPAARAFHAAIGYAEIAVIPRVGWKFGRWFDLVLMQKFLS